MGNTGSVVQSTADSLAKNLYNNNDEKTPSPGTGQPSHSSVSSITHIVLHSSKTYCVILQAHAGFHSYHHHHPHANLRKGDVVYPSECPMHNQQGSKVNEVPSVSRFLK